MGDKSTVKAIKQRLNVEQTNQVYKKLHDIRGTTASGITQLHIHQNDNDTNYAECKELISINTLVEIEQHL